MKKKARKKKVLTMAELSVTQARLRRAYCNEVEAIRRQMAIDRENTAECLRLQYESLGVIRREWETFRDQMTLLANGVAKQRESQDSIQDSQSAELKALVKRMNLHQELMDREVVRVATLASECQNDLRALSVHLNTLRNDQKTLNENFVKVQSGIEESLKQCLATEWAALQASMKALESQVEQAKALAPSVGLIKYLGIVSARVDTLTLAMANGEKAKP